MKLRLNENQFKSLITRIVNESVNTIIKESKGKDKLQNSFKSKEDMTALRDKYSPYSQNSIIDTDNTVYDTDVEGGGEWGSGPYASYRNHTFADGYDYCGDDLYNDAASDYNSGLEKKLATKGGQMSDDWERFGPKEYPAKQKERDFDRAYRDRGFKDWDDHTLEKGKKHMRGWVKNGHTNPEYEKFGMAEPDKQFGEDPFDRMETSIY